MSFDTVSNPTRTGASRTSFIGAVFQIGVRFKRNVQQITASKNCADKPHSRGILRAAGFRIPVSVPSSSAVDADTNPFQRDEIRTTFIGAVT